jgi:hypothetical protein
MLQTYQALGLTVVTAGPHLWRPLANASAWAVVCICQSAELPLVISELLYTPSTVPDSHKPLTHITVPRTSPTRWDIKPQLHVLLTA